MVYSNIQLFCKGTSTLTYYEIMPFYVTVYFILEGN